ncbi:MAG TPA: TonB-dependent siderophore receptor [Alphaproteobacteria bacterium]|nr:TonB-dependent siderophore receptor [Alphaproteobacteria bacterium]
MVSNNSLRTVDNPAPRATRRRTLLSSSAIGTALFLATAASAQQATAPITLPTLPVEGNGAADYKVDQPALTKLTEPLLDTPQSITTVSKALMQDRGETTLSDALRNVPGISLGAGEFSWQGTNVTIRGFNARNDMYLDGMRDFGSYYRDPFNLDEVQVLEGPSAMLFGRGSAGGVINQVSKTPTLQPMYSGTLSAGTDETRRLTADIDQPLPELGEGVAARLNLMGHDSMVAGRDVGEYQRYGVAPSLALGLGTPTRLIFSYFHQTESDTPDYGIPWYQGSPAPVPRNNFYGFKSDYLNTNADIVTGRIEHDFADTITVSSQLRYADYFRDFRISEPVVPSTTPIGTPPSAVSISRNEWSGYSRETFLQDQTDATVKFETGGIQHTLVTGIEVGQETSGPEFDNGMNVPTNSLLNPNENQAYTGTNFPRLKADTIAFTLGIYAIDTVKITDQLEVTGGVRWDRFNADYHAATYSQPPLPTGTIVSHNDFEELDQLPSWRFGIVYKPLPIGSLYFDYSSSYNPSAEGLSQITSGRALGVGNEGLAPEKNRNFEVGTKWDFMDGKIGARAALFREEKYNARVANAAIPGFSVLGGDQLVNGFDLEVTGHITPEWQVNAGYTYLHSEVTRAAPGAAVGSPLFDAPKHSATLWTEYALPIGGEIGGGLNYVSSRYGQTSAPIELAPSYITFDAMAKYPVTDNIGVQVNIYNITDKYYYDQIHGFHISPGAGRSALFSLNVKY